MDELRLVGPRLRDARSARGWTLADLAGRAGMSPSTLSRLESGKRQASLELLLPLTKQLGISIDDLVRTETPDPRVRRAPRQRDGMTVTPLAREDARVATYRITYEPRHTLPPLRTHAGFEWLHVVSGRLRLRLGERDLVLGRGESAQFDTSTPHALSAAGGHPATIISIFDESGERTHTHPSGVADLEP